MSPAILKPATSAAAHPQHDGNRQLDREIRNMVAALTSRLTHVHHLTKTPSGEGSGDDDGRGAELLTLTGTNEGASMRVGFEEDAGVAPEEAVSGAYVNSNFQAVNNSIMLGGSYKAEEPGVHMVITELVQDGAEKKEKKAKKKKIRASVEE